MDEDRMPSDRITETIRRNWAYKYPLSIAFITAVQNGTIPEDTTIVDFVTSPHCEERLKNNNAIKYITSHNFPEAP